MIFEDIKPKTSAMRSGGKPSIQGSWPHRAPTLRRNVDLSAAENGTAYANEARATPGHAHPREREILKTGKRSIEVTWSRHLARRRARRTARSSLELVRTPLAYREPPARCATSLGDETTATPGPTCVTCPDNLSLLDQRGHRQRALRRKASVICPRPTRHAMHTHAQEASRRDHDRAHRLLQHASPPDRDVPRAPGHLSISENARPVASSSPHDVVEASSGLPEPRAPSTIPLIARTLRPD